MIQVTLGSGLHNARGVTVDISVEPVAELARVLGERKGREAWWSGHVFLHEQRCTKDWAGSSCIHLDLDHYNEDGKHIALPPDLAEDLALAARELRLPGSLFHLTPRGARVVVVLAELCTDRDVYKAAAAYASQRVRTAIAPWPALQIDDSVLLDLARILYTPNSTVGGNERRADVVVMRRDPVAIAALTPPLRNLVPLSSISDAVARYNAEHSREYPLNGGSCPACGHKGCFGRLPDDSSKWTCFSVGHSGAGKQGQGCWYGDALDLDAHAAGAKPAELLRRQGYLAGLAAHTNIVTDESRPDPEQEPLSKSYGSVCRILRDPELRRVLLGTDHPLEWNEMTRGVEWGRNPVDEGMVGVIRERTEVFLRDRKGRRLELSRENIEAAIAQVARETSYHPVRDYLNRLVWDGEQRISHIASDVLSLSATHLQQSMIRGWLVSAVARAMTPGCKVDTVLILAGPQGIGKSTFFSTLAGAWFRDSMVDLTNKDAFQVLHGAWIFEWAELETMARSKRSATVKAFLTSRVDSYRPAYARAAQDHPRSCVIVGSTNDLAFLDDPTGNRRFWIVPVDAVDTPALAVMRDQVWAEAVAAFRAGEPWWLSEDDERELAPTQATHTTEDPWEEAVLRYATAQKVVTLSGVLHSAVEKRHGDWLRSDQARVAAILTAAGYRPTRARDPSGAQFRCWKLYR